MSTDTRTRTGTPGKPRLLSPFQDDSLPVRIMSVYALEGIWTHTRAELKSAASAVGLQEQIIMIQDRGTVLALRARHKPLKSAFWVQCVCCINKVDTIPPILQNKNTACVQTVLNGIKRRIDISHQSSPYESAIRIRTQQKGSLSRRNGKARW